MSCTPSPPAPSPDDQLVVRVQLTVCDAEVDVRVVVQRPRVVRSPGRRRLAALAGRLPELVAGAIVGVLVEHLAALLTTLL
jgi:hypothetical protein